MIALKRRYVISTTVAVVLIGAASWVTGEAYSSIQANLLAKLGLTAAGMVVVAAMWILFAVARREKAESERRYRAIFDQAAELMGAATPDGKMIEVNKVALDMLGLERTQILGKPIWEIPWQPHSSAYQQRLANQFQGAVEGAAAGETVRQSHRLVDPIGNERVFDFIATPVKDDRGSVDFLAARSRDVTERVRAEEALRRSRQRSQELSRRLIEAQEQERSHIARELHDHVGQALTAVKLNLETIERGGDDRAIFERVSDSRNIVVELLEEVRTLALELRPPMLDDLGLVAALRWYTNRQAERAGLGMEFRAPDSPVQLEDEVASACFRVAQEAITNVVKHANAQRLSVQLSREEDDLVLTVRDDGIGFDANALSEGPPDRASMGTIGMQERVFLVGGRLSIESQPGKGTTVQARFPLKRNGNGKAGP
jgi:PAS domain S-box-containing protein